MALPQPFTTTSQRVASYDYTDLDDNAGYIKYLAFADTNNSSTTYGLVKSAVYGDPTFTSNTTSSGNVTVLDGDFDLLFNTPKTLNGDVVANIPCSCSSNQVNGAEVDVVMTVKRVRDAAETDLGTVTSARLQSTTANVTVHNMYCLKLNIDNELFQQGDTLRITLLVTLYRNNGACNGLIYHDPQGATTSGDATFVSSVCSFDCPFKIED